MLSASAVGDIERLTADVLAKRLAVEQLHHQEWMARRLTDVVNRANIGMIQRRSGARLALETLSRSLGRKGLRQNLDGYVAMQPRVPRLIHLAHAALADGGEDLVGAKASSGGKGRPVARSQPELVGWLARWVESYVLLPGCDFNRRRFDKAPRLLLVREQSLHIAAERLIRAAGFFQVCPALVRRAFQSRVIELLHLLPPLGLHQRSPSRNSRISQTLATFQSRMTVSAETFNTPAVSSTVVPPKKRNSTTRASLWNREPNCSAITLIATARPQSCITCLEDLAHAAGSQ